MAVQVRGAGTRGGLRRGAGPPQTCLARADGTVQSWARSPIWGQNHRSDHRARRGAEGPRVPPSTVLNHTALHAQGRAVIGLSGGLREARAPVQRVPDPPSACVS